MLWVCVFKETTKIWEIPEIVGMLEYVSNMKTTSMQLVQCKETPVTQHNSFEMLEIMKTL